MSKLNDFINERERLTEKTLDFGKKNIKRFFNLDWNTYQDGALDKKTKEMLGLVASMVLRCDDCINYHMIELCKAGINDDELEEVFSIALLVGGSIVIPHLRRAVDKWDEIKEHFEPSIDKDKEELFAYLLDRTEQILLKEKDLNKALQNICDLLDKKVPYYNWTGFYIADADSKTLHLGPYVGESTEHVKIAYGKGICGQTAETNETFIVPDVSLQGNYLACSIKTKSEIVVPIFNKDGQFAAELDIDSHEINPFDSIDKDYLEKICTVIGNYF
ncbi:MAG: carboxymuconolactone decarboxylase family protein [Candidatus Cloacimonadales bacterium]|jgi:GAF domain-containing protein|nr:carboxymuconolactone decarboxylase family protein [Candidatus Cloacimonadota bacterium]MDX9977800.1 carboxymuconolactone decarboxylase family protein [Candidatus Cloacimonadales bacterium]